MKAIVYSNHGSSNDLQFQEVAKPAPRDSEVLIRIHATTAMAAGLGVARSASFIPGQDLAGEVEAVGRRVTRFKKDDQIVAWSGLRLSAYAEYTCLPERGALFTKPANISGHPSCWWA